MAEGMAGDARLMAALRQIVGEDGLILDPAERAFLAADVYAEGVLPLAAVRPPSAEATAALLRLCAAEGVAVHPRGGAMSYTDAFAPSRARALVLDTGALDRIVEINARDLYVTVECGATWAALDAALSPHGVRAAFWGPMSGATATIGGGVSHGAATFGSGHVGASGAAVLGLEVALTDGSLLRTGHDAIPGAKPFLRQYGPDLTPLFVHDGGAFGVKTKITLALVPRAGAVGGLSFVFGRFDAMAEAVERVARADLASEIIATDKAVLAMAMGARNWKEDLTLGLSVLRAAPDPARGFSRLARIALEGRRALANAAYAAHFVIEGRDGRDLAGKIEAARALIGARGTETAPAFPLALRAMPFPPLPVTAMDGRRLLALHGVLSFSALAAAHAEIAALTEAAAPELAAAKAQLMFVFTTLGRNAFLYEPFLYWEDALAPYHVRRSPEALRQNWPERADNPAARALIERLKAEFVALFRRHGAAHLQIGRVYPWFAAREGANAALFHDLKRQLDPKGVLNPGVLGLPAGEA